METHLITQSNRSFFHVISTITSCDGWPYISSLLFTGKWYIGVKRTLFIGFENHLIPSYELNEKQLFDMQLLLFFSYFKIIIFWGKICNSGKKNLNSIVNWKSLSHVQLTATPWTVHGILQARILEWVAVPFSRGFSQPRVWTQVSCTAGKTN